MTSNAAMEKTPSDESLEERLLRIKEMLRSGNRETGDLSIRELLDDHPDDFELHLTSIDILSAAQLGKEAERLAKEAVQKFPQRLRAHERLVRTFLKSGNNTEAAKYAVSVC